MSKKKETVYESIHVTIATSERSPSLVKLTVVDPSNQKAIAEFFVPGESRDKKGLVSKDIIASRLKRDFDISFNHWSVTMHK